MPDPRRSQPKISRRREEIERADVAPPRNLDAEKSVLGAMLVSKENAIYGAEHLAPEDFWRGPHAVLFGAMQRLVGQHVGLDFVTVAQALTPEQLSVVEGPAYIASLTDGVPRGTNLPYYVDILRDLRVRREVLGISDQILAAVQAGETSGTELLAQVDQWAMTIERAQGGAELQAQPAVVAATMMDLERRIAARGALSGVPSGFVAVDEYTSGWQAGDFILLGARPSVGKTALALNMALAAARAGVTVAIFSLEMSVAQLEYRFFSTISGVMLFKILKGYLTDLDQQRIGVASAELHGLPIYIDDTATMTAPQIRAKARQLQVQRGLGLVIVDYLQLVEGATGRRDASRQEQVADISRKFKTTAKDLGVPLIALSQLSRAPEDRKDAKPRLSDLRESGALEQDADIVGFIHRADYKVSGPASLLVDKARNGPTFAVELEFDRETVKFSDAPV